MTLGIHHDRRARRWQGPGQGHDLVLVSVDLNDQVEVPKKTTPRAVLAAAGLDPETRQLVRVHGRTQTLTPTWTPLSRSTRARSS